MSVSMAHVNLVHWAVRVGVALRLAQKNLCTLAVMEFVSEFYNYFLS